MSQKLTQPPPEATLEDPDLIRRFRAGDDEAFDEVVRLYAESIRMLAHRLLGWQGPAEDIAQDVFVAALAHRRRFRAQSGIRTWLFQITLNKCRAWKYRRKLFFNFLKRQKDVVHQVVHPVEGSEQFDHVQKAMAGLPDKYRQVIVFKYLDELPTSEMVEILGISESALNTRLSRGRQMLRETLMNENVS